MTQKFRAAISAKNRFEIFKRDGFKCIYCGAAAPDAVLVVDHVTPYSESADDSLENLATACLGCNKGKGKTPLSALKHFDNPHGGNSGSGGKRPGAGRKLRSEAGPAVTTGFRLPPDLLAALRAKAKRDKIPASALVVRALREMLEREP